MIGVKTTHYESVTFDHVTFQTGDNYVHRDFVPTPSTATILTPIAEHGWHDLEPLGLPETSVRIFHDSDLTKFDLNYQEVEVLRCHLCLDPKTAPQVWSNALAYHRDLYSKLLATVPEPLLPFLSAFARTPALRQPVGLFLTVTLLPTVFRYPDLGLLGALERDLFYAIWRRHLSRTATANSQATENFDAHIN